jgi:hypothetical protein
MARKRQRRKRRRRSAEGRPTRSAGPSALVLDDPQRAAPARRKAAPGKRPEALWGSFPLSELVVLIALVLLVVGFVTGAAVTLGVGLGLGALAGVELAAREHFAGYRSHNVLLAGAAGMTVFGLLFVLTPLSPAVCVAAGAIVFGGSAWLLVAAFRRLAGGASYRIRP